MKTAVVSGASTGIGRAVSLELSAHGYEVYLVARNEKKLEETKQIIEQSGGKAQIITADLSSVDSIQELLNTLTNSFETLHVLANIAGIWHGTDDVYADTDFQTFD